MKSLTGTIVFLMSVVALGQKYSPVVVVDMGYTQEKGGWAAVGALYGSVVPIIGTAIGGVIGYIYAPKDGYIVVKTCDDVSAYGKVPSESIANGTMFGDTVTIDINTIRPLAVDEYKKIFDREKHRRTAEHY